MHRPGSVLWEFIAESVREAGLSPDIQPGGRNEQAFPIPRKTLNGSFFLNA